MVRIDQLSLSCEEQLLLYCSRITPSDEIVEKIRSILNINLDWEDILKSSVLQGIIPLLYWNLSRIDAGKNVPVKIMDDLQKMYYGNLTRNMLLYHELSNILKAFKAEGIDVIVLKGAFLAEVIYKNIGLRPMKDIDLLIREEDLPVTIKEMARLKCHFANIFPTKLHEQLYVQLQPTLSEELQYINQNNNVIIEVHWDIQPPTSPFKIEIKTFWKNAKPIKIAGIETLMLAPEDLIKHLCLHLNKHNHLKEYPAKPLRDYCDIAEVTKHYRETINWSYLLQSSKNHGIEEPIYQILSVADKYFDAFVPTEISSELETVKASADFEDILRMRREDDPEGEDKPKEFSYLINLKKIDGFWNKARILLGDVFPCKEFMVQRYQTRNKKPISVFYIIRFGTALHWGLKILWQLPHYIVEN